MKAEERFSLPDELLLYLRTSGRECSIASLAKRFKVSRETIDDALDSIVSWQYKLKRHKETVQFVQAPDLLSAVEIQYRLKTKLIGRQVHSYRSLKSTNDLATDLAEHGAPEGTIVTAETQTHGKGRLGRGWHSASGTGIYVSIILRPTFPPDRAPGLSIMSALALAEALKTREVGDLRIKWPNDLLIAGRKVAGILTELSAEQGRINHVIVGIGINANHKPEDFPAELRDSATSVRIAARRLVNRAELVREFLHQFERQYRKYQKAGLKPSHSTLKKYSSLLGEHVRLETGGHRVEGKAIDITETGALVLQCGEERLVVSAGEVSVLKK
jgi:BirA family transcriptional regulator, biotin operon repressor / biotin---[acetyl-CoA-carboxylase] ligase